MLVGGEEEVFGFEVAVDYPVGVAVLDDVDHLAEQVARLSFAQAARLRQVCEQLSAFAVTSSR